MPAYPIDKQLVIAVSSSALFDLTESTRNLKYFTAGRRLNIRGN